MQFRRCSSPSCSRPFQVNQYKPRASHSFEFGKITCPHCGQQEDDDRHSVFLTHAMSAAEEEEFNNRHAHAGEHAAAGASSAAHASLGRMQAGHAHGEHPSGGSARNENAHPDSPRKNPRKSGSSGESHSQ